MTDYDTNFSPSAPSVAVRVLNPGTGRAADVTALVDTGSALSILPLNVVNRLGFRSAGKVAVRGFDGGRRTVPLFSGTWVVAGYVLLGVEFAGMVGTSALLGRDVLRHFILTLNGKIESFDLVDPWLLVVTLPKPLETSAVPVYSSVTSMT